MNDKYFVVLENVVDIEIESLVELKKSVGDSFTKACEVILNCQGRLIITGMGKSGLVGRKIAATMASTGTPAFFVHPGEAGHGDLGMIVKGDVVLAISNSGNSDEINILLPVIKRLNLPLISITKNLSGRLAQEADIALTLGDFEEACPMGLAPTSSTTATMVLGDALAIALLKARGFKSEDFALSHPAGSLGKNLLTHVGDLMKSGDEIPLVSGNTSILDALFEITEKRLGMTVVVSEEGDYGLLTDGDIRRLLTINQDMNQPIASVMKTAPITTSRDTLAAEALNIMRQKKVNQLIVLENRKLVGVLALRDLVQAGIN
ncbi:KpsF/GutQ family sugar-phosphate isomerase [Psychrobacter sp. APC 3279]|uniref:KpsF/GutQ family sugar-phosphate isomerase n=1 Tax=Psychrobacter sp. APC 3279 TaxID=3035189 RepID=UPI0025B59AC8|nr:KpsF/GutQ family sugar-phosphate isomerase [Psychrobacter sp. APC 3279]MDN3441293.1 KpsF/GutQ family sugar-phosphate isomerase [Psychrobacter sp. APC 3279]